MGASERNWVEADSQADGVGERTLTLLPVENCVEASCCRTGFWVSAPYLTHYLRGHLAEEASGASLDSIEVRRDGPKCVFIFQYIPCLSGKGIGSISV